MATAVPGDAVRVTWRAVSEAPVPATFDQGAVRLVVGGGGFLPCLHAACANVDVGLQATVEVAAADTGFGRPNPNLGPVEVPLEMAPDGLAVGMSVQLENGLAARVVAMTSSTFTIDANDPNAGQPLTLEVEVTEVDPQVRRRAHVAYKCIPPSVPPQLTARCCRY